MLVRNQHKSEYPTTPAVVLCVARGFKIIVDPETYPTLAIYNWTVKKSFYRWYAGRWIKKNGKKKFIFMHRIITGCDNHMVVHHVNHDTMDNRMANLQILTDYEHKEYHSWR